MGRKATPPPNGAHKQRRDQKKYLTRNIFDILSLENDENQMCKFQMLPLDIHCNIASYLDYADAFNVSLANRYFHENLNPTIVLPRCRWAPFFARADLNRYWYSKKRERKQTKRWACFGCCRFLPKESFGDRMRKNKWGKRGQQQSRLGRRRCWDCAIAERLYEHLQPVLKDGEKFYLCHTCGRMQHEWKKCEESACYEESTVAPSSHLAQLGSELLENIVLDIGLLDAIHLRQANRHLRDTVRTSWVPLHKRFGFVKQWEPEIHWAFGLPHPRIRDIPKLPCYSCFTVKAFKKFPIRQHRYLATYPDTFWKRRCGACVNVLYNNSTKGWSEEGLEDYKSQTLCDDCCYLKHTEEKCHNCMSNCAEVSGHAVSKPGAGTETTERGLNEDCCFERRGQS